MTGFSHEVPHPRLRGAWLRVSRIALAWSMRPHAPAIRGNVNHVPDSEGRAGITGFSPVPPIGFGEPGCANRAALAWSTCPHAPAIQGNVNHVPDSEGRAGITGFSPIPPIGFGEPGCANRAAGLVNVPSRASP